MARLPIPGADDNQWGNILNAYLSVSLNGNGTIQTSALSSAGGEVVTNKGVAGGYASLNGSGQVPSGQLPTSTLAGDSDVNISSPANNQVLTYNSGTSKWVNQTAPSGVMLNSNAANIQPLGTQAAGTTGTAADASHVHAMPTLNQINHPTSSVSLNSQKITGLANGTVATDAAAFGQIPTALPPNGTAGGDLTGTYPNPTVTATANFKAQVETVRLDQMAEPTSAVDFNDQKITGITNGTASTDAAAFGQIPTALPPSGSAGGDLTGTYPSPTVTATANFKAQVETVRLDQMAAPSAAVALNSQKITGLANGTASTDAAAFGQIPTSAGSIGGLQAANNLSDVANASTSRNNLSAAQWFAATAAKSGTYPAVAGDFIPVDASGGSATITLPTTPADKTRIGVKMIALSGSNTVTINTGGTDVFNKSGGATSLTLSLLSQGVLLQYATGSPGIWYVQADDIPLSQLDSRYMGKSTYDPAGVNQQVLGTTATQTTSNKRITKRVVTSTANTATPAINTDTLDYFKITGQSTNITSFTTNLSGTPNDGDTLVIWITDNGSAITLAWGSSFASSTVALPTTTVASTPLIIGFMWNPVTTKWRCVAVA